MAAFEALACGDDGGVKIAEKRVAQCMRRLAKAAIVLDRVRVERGDDEGRKLVEARGGPPRTSDGSGPGC